MPEKNWIQKSVHVAEPLILYWILVQILGMYAAAAVPELCRNHGMAVQCAINLILFPVLYFGFFRRDGKDIRNSMTAAEGIYMILAAIFLSRGLNQLIMLSPLPQLFPGYEAVNRAISEDSLWIQFIMVGAAAPLLEELLMRGIAYRRMRRFLGVQAAVPGSALLFALFHGNVIQGLYAFGVGMLFAMIYERSGRLWMCVLAHGAVNAVSLLLTILPLQICESGFIAAVCAASAELLLAAFLIRQTIQKR